MRLARSVGHVLGGTFLIAGTTIGVGMLALPVVTGPAGFVPSVAIYLVCWLFMLCTGFLLLEVCIWLPKDANLISMSRHLLGPIGKNVCWAVYLFLFVTVMIAHVAGGGSVLSEITGGKLSQPLAMIIYVLVFSPVIYMGTRSVDRLNICLMSGVILSYLLFILVSSGHVNLDLLRFASWPKIWFALPVLFISFIYQLIIPTLMTYLDRNVKKVRLCIVLGTAIPLVVYLIWEFLILGIIPIEGPGGLIEAGQKGYNAVTPLRQFVNSSSLYHVGKAFAFFTLTTSYIALALAFLDFLADGLEVEKKGFKKFLLCLAIFLPPTLIALTYPGIFLTALSYAGGISGAVLFGLFPPLMVWAGRYIKKQPKQARQLIGGRVLLSCLILFALFEIGIEFAKQMT
jgi:tyrosine-specific transport protein